MALDDRDREWIQRLVEGVSDSFAEAIAEEIGPMRTTLKETLNVQKQILDRQDKVLVDLPLALARVLEPKLNDQQKAIDELRAEVAKLKSAVFGSNGGSKK